MDYYNYQQTQNILMPVYRSRIINELANKEEKLKTISKKYCLKRKREREIKKIILPAYGRLKRVIKNGKK